jgi:Tat protein secretion system quality control protein TatD with DNase activity
LSEQETQKVAFARQLQKAVEHKKPLVIHSRDAEAVRVRQARFLARLND